MGVEEFKKPLLLRQCETSPSILVRYGELRELAEREFGPGGTFHIEWRRTIEPALECEFCEADHAEIVRRFGDWVDWKSRELQAAATGDYDLARAARDWRVPQAHRRLKSALSNARLRTVPLDEPAAELVLRYVDESGRVGGRRDTASLMPEKDVRALTALGIPPGSMLLRVNTDRWEGRHQLQDRLEHLEVKVRVAHLLRDAEMLTAAREACLEPEPVPGMVWVWLVSFLLAGCACAAAAGWLDQHHPDSFYRGDTWYPHWGSLARRYFPSYENAFRIPGCAEANIAAGQIGDTDGTGQALQAALSTGKCWYRVPYVAVFTAGCAGCLGLAVVSFISVHTFTKSRGSGEMSDAGFRLSDVSGVYLGKASKVLLVGILVLGTGAYFAVDWHNRDRNDYLPEAGLSALVAAIFGLAAGYIALRAAGEASCRAAAECWLHSKQSGAASALRLAFRAGGAAGIAAFSAATLGVATVYGAFGSVNACIGFAFGASCAALVLRLGAGVSAAAAAQAAQRCGASEDVDSAGHTLSVAAIVTSGMLSNACERFDTTSGALTAAAVIGGAEFGPHGVALPLYLATVIIGANVLSCWRVAVPEKERDNEGIFARLSRSLDLNVSLGRVLVILGSLGACLGALYGPAKDLKDAPGRAERELHPDVRLWGCAVISLVICTVLSFIAIFFVRNRHPPVQSIARAAVSGVGPMLVRGLGCAMHYAGLHLVAVAGIVVISYRLAGWYGLPIAALGGSGMMPFVLAATTSNTIGHQAEYISSTSLQVPAWVKDVATIVRRIGREYAPRHKSLADMTSALSAIALLAAFGHQAGLQDVNLLSTRVASGVLAGALVPFMFAALVVNATANAARRTTVTIRQAEEVLQSAAQDDTEAEYEYERCASVLAKQTLIEITLPSLLGLAVAPVMGFTFGSSCLYGLLLGAICSALLLGAQLGIAGMAWKSARQWIEAEEFEAVQPRRTVEGKLHLHKGAVIDEKVVMSAGSVGHEATIQGDNAGTVHREAVGPGLNTLVKVMTTSSLVLARRFDEDWDEWHVGLKCLGVAVILVIAAIFVRRAQRGPQQEPDEGGFQSAPDDGDAPETEQHLDPAGEDVQPPTPASPAY
eukprot:TRINITY_DN55350_c0_g1_i1.p1 TRINITY_DN55350_c0_g1~~TRINITY_DN55350_c0_g1_i1.p1  ORF type:complete len:1107 (+),score=320.44 TRINITY_DN55350_c0_g1_i1:110-3430(+)